jgi:DNA-binding NarL/FixJ family response regulator
MAMPPAVPAAGDAAAAVGPDVLAAALGASAHGVALLDEQGRCVHVNPAGCALLGALAEQGALPDTVLMDLVMPEPDGVATTALIKKAYPAVDVVVVTSFGEAHRVHSALEAAPAGTCSRTRTSTRSSRRSARRIVGRCISTALSRGCSPGHSSHRGKEWPR